MNKRIVFVPSRGTRFLIDVKDIYGCLTYSFRPLSGYSISNRPDVPVYAGWNSRVFVPSRGTRFLMACAG